MKSSLSLLTLFTFTFMPLNINLAKADTVNARVSYGKVQVLQAGIDAGYGAAEGFTIMVREDNSTNITTQFKGLQNNISYPLHVHVLSCDKGAGGHYKIDSTISTSVETNEIWLNFSSDNNGIGGINTDRNFVTTSDAASIIVHDPVSKAKLLCIDLLPVKL